MKITNSFTSKVLTVITGSVILVACGASNPPIQSDGHLQVPEEKPASIPETVSTTPVLKRPHKRRKVETYTIVVNQVPVRGLLFSMARNAHVNLDIDNNIHGRITMNAIDQTLPKILDRIAEQVDIIYSIEGNTLRVRADVPVLRIYNVHYLNISRTSKGKVSISTEIGTSGTGIQSIGGSGGGNGSGSNSGSGSSSSSGNKAKTSVESESINTFWKTLASNIASIIYKPSKKTTGNTINNNKNIIVNRESGIIAVRATLRKQKQVAEFISRVVNSAQRQVLIEATVAEVRLSDKYQAGVDWSVVGEKATIGGVSVLKKGAVQSVLSGNLGAAPFFQLAGVGSVNGNPLNVTLKALETFGNVKVLSSPKVMALNNQTAILKVVDNEVYFTTNVQLDAGSVNQKATTAVNTEINTVPIGFIMSVTPFIDSDGEVTLNVRPTISRVIRFVNDPNPELAALNVVSQIPVIQVREIETMLKIKDRDTAVIGGLMQDQVEKTKQGIPLLSSIPLVGNLFSYKKDEYVKTELVIFIRPVVIHNASLTGDLSNYKKYLNLDIYHEGKQHNDEMLKLKDTSDVIRQTP